MESLSFLILGTLGAAAMGCCNHFKPRLVSLLLISALFLPQMAFANDVQAPIRSIALKVKPVSNRKTSVSNWETSWGSYDKDNYRNQIIGYEVRNYSKDPAPNVEVWAVWVARDTRLKVRAIYGIEIKKYDLAPGETASGEFASPVLKMNQTRFYGETIRRDGEKPDGYMVLVKYDGEQGNIYHSNTGMKNLFENQKEFEQLLKEYRESGKSPSR